MGSGGLGSAQHIYGELFKAMAGVDMLHVPYRGGAPAMTDLLAGQVPLMFDTFATSIEHVRGGKLRALGVTALSRSPALPDVPPIAETVPGYEGVGWQGIAAPRGTPIAIIERINRELNASLADPKLQARIADVGGTVFTTSPSKFADYVARYTEEWAKVIKNAGIKAD